jgi:hypothetical protein
MPGGGKKRSIRFRRNDLGQNSQVGAVAEAVVSGLGYPQS